MPTEARYIFFTPSEALTAVRELRSRRGQPLAHGSVKVAEVPAPPEIGYRVVIARDDNMTEREYLIDGSELGAALVLFCMRRGIPLPASAPKSLLLNGDELVLAINRNASRTQLEWLLRARFGPSPSRAAAATTRQPGAGGPDAAGRSSPTALNVAVGS